MGLGLNSPGESELEGGKHLLGDRDLGAIARVSPGARPALLDREYPEVAQLYLIAPRQAGRDRVQDGVDDLLHIPVVQVRVLGRDPLNQFRLDHRGVRGSTVTGARAARTGRAISLRIKREPPARLRQGRWALSFISCARWGWGRV